LEELNDLCGSCALTLIFYATKAQGNQGLSGICGFAILATLREAFNLHSSKSTPVARSTYNVYVVELSKKVFTENWRFREANPQFNGVLECLYVGMTSKTPAERFKQHKTGYISKKGYKISAYIVEKYGSYLRPSLYDHINVKPMTRQQALLMEKKLAQDLRRQGYAVWFN